MEPAPSPKLAPPLALPPPVDLRARRLARLRRLIRRGAYAVDERRLAERLFLRLPQQASIG